ncbi:MAG: S41 family peptidase [Thiotrichaceae bacterium]|nr:S41 family peptidase [Thiotrichaceae bacterium]
MDDELNQYLSSLDPYSKYLSPEKNDFFKKRQALKQFSIGINILVGEDNMLVVPLKNKPAYKSGLTQAQYLKTLNAQKIALDNFDSYRFLTELELNQKVHIEVSSSLARATTQTYQVKPAKMDNPSIQYINGTYPIIRVYRFDDRDKTQEKLKKYVQQSLKAKKPIIIDLRYCPGGSFYGAIDATSWFLKPKLPVAYLKTAKSDNLTKFESFSGKVVKQQKVYLWTSPYTASAAEVFIRALQAHSDHAVVIGTETKGKCLSQQAFEFEDGSSLTLSVYEILTPNQQLCEGKGIKPDIAIKSNNILNDQDYLQYSKK